MKFIFITLFLLLFSCISIKSQDIQHDFSFLSTENLEFTALKPLFYLIRQEYILVDENGKEITRGGNDFYGKAYTIGVSEHGNKLWYPNYIRLPWKFDDTFDARLTRSMKPECSLFCIKNYFDKDYFKTIIHNTNESDLLTFVPYDARSGIYLEESIQDKGTLIIFYSSAASPDDFSDISHSLILLENITWNENGISEIKELRFGNNKIIGGALFSKYISPGSVTWKLSGLYIPVGDKCILKSIGKK